MSLPLNASFGVFAAFVVFCALFGRQAVLMLIKRVHRYQEKELDKLQAAETLLKDAEACFEEAQQKAERTAETVSEIQKSVTAQTMHIKNNAIQELEVFKARTKESANKDLEKLKEALSHALEYHACTNVVADVSQKTIQAPLGTLCTADTMLEKFFKNT